MTLVTPTQVNPGDDITANSVNAPINEIAAVINGNLDDTNISGISGSKVASGTLPGSAIVDSGWQTPTYNSSYNSTSTAQYRKIGNLLVFRGAMVRNSGNVTNSDGLFTLPPTYYPGIDAQAFVTPGTGGTTIKTNINTSTGAITVIGVQGTTTYLRMDGITCTVD